MTKRQKVKLPRLPISKAAIKEAVKATQPHPAIVDVKFIPAGTPEVHRIDPALARGAEGKVSTHCRKSLSDQKASRPKAEPEVTDAKVRNALAKASFPRRSRPLASNRAAAGSKLVLKANKEVRALLTKAAQAAGGTRLSPISFKDYSAFLNGVPLDKDGNAEVAFVPVKGNAPIQGKNVKLTIRAGKVAKIK